MGIQVAPRISFRQMPDMGLGKSLSYVFVPAYFCKPNPLFCFWVVVFELLRSQMLIHTFPKRCSHISMGVLILLIIEIVMSILSNRCASLHVDPINFNIRKINSKFSQRCLFHPSQVAFVFPALPPFFFKDSDFLIKYPFCWCEVSSLFSINVLIRWFSGRF